MDKLMSWRLSRISERSAWKNALNSEFILGMIGFALCIVYMAIPLPDKELEVLLSWLISFCGICFFVHCLSMVLRADDYFKVQMGNKQCWVYVYRVTHKYRPSTYEILLRTKDAEYLVFASQYKRKIYSGSHNAFIYCLADNDENGTWMLINKYSHDIQKLGQKVGKHVFLSPKNQEGKKIILNVLQDDGYTEICADRYICENICVPQEDEMEVIYKGEIVEAAVPNEYLIIKDDNKYQVWGIYSSEKNNPRCYALSVPSIIFHEGKDTVILLGKHFEYTTLYRGNSLGRKSTTLISEVYDKEGCRGVYGTVYRFNPKTQTLDQLYDGAILGIHFDDGEINGENGQVFKP